MCNETKYRRAITHSSINKELFEEAAGTDRVPPGVLKMLSDDWIILLTHLFNLVFLYNYPLQWALAKMFTIYKKGPILDTGNYRGISILVALAKLYDAILNVRFTLWFKPDLEQAGGQEGRSCAEQLLTLRLLIDVARKRKLTLYISFIDYVKAYDRVNRSKLLQMLADKGCGNKFLQAIGKSMEHTHSVIGSEQFESTMGVRQGGSTSCSLFTFYINCTIESIRSYGRDGFLGGVHSLLLMDDTVILATTRQAMYAKLRLLYESTKSINMEIHRKK